MPPSNQPDEQHLIETIDKAISQLQNAKMLLRRKDPRALHSLVRASDAVWYARKAGTKLGYSVRPKVENW